MSMFGNFGGFDDSDDDFFGGGGSMFGRRGGPGNLALGNGGGRGSSGSNDNHRRNSNSDRRNNNQIVSRDPFEAMNRRMDEMMGGFGSMGGMGMGIGGGSMLSEMMKDMEMGHRGGGRNSNGNNGGGMMQQFTSFSSSSGNGPSFQQSSSMVVSSKMGADGKMHTERYSSSSVKDGHRDAYERQQAYSNSSTGHDKMALERSHRGQGRKMVKEFDHRSGEERQHQYFKGMDESNAGDFDDRWNRDIAPNMPKHSHGGYNMNNHGQQQQQIMLGHGKRRSSGGGGGGGQRALGYR